MALQNHTSELIRPIRLLSLIFASWKALIWLVTYSSPGIGYDTSPDLLGHVSNDSSHLQTVPLSLSTHSLRWVRWDAVYFTETSRRGHVFEQEWAFGKVWYLVLSYASKLFGSSASNDISSYATSGVLISHLAHWLSVIILFLLTRMLHDSTTTASRSVPLVTAILHIISPAGVFLSAPYAEALFSCLNMLGFYLHAKSLQDGLHEINPATITYRISSGIVLGLATSIRSNGIFSGVLFLIDVLEALTLLLSSRVDYFSKARPLLHLQTSVVAGCCVAVGMVYPQFLAYKQYCVDGRAERPWCDGMPPSIYTFVQSHYWNVGFLKYWTISNLPLFFLALPCLYLLIVSGVKEIAVGMSSSSTISQRIRLRLGLPQLLLALLAITNYHVQIITRLASGYPLWYIWVAGGIQERKHSELTVRILTMYALIQAALFAAFLPPA